MSQAFRQLIMTGTKAEDLVSRLARRYGLTHASLNALAAIEAAGGPLPAGEISTRMHYTTGTMTGILDTLERKGYVRRIADPSDRRRSWSTSRPEPSTCSTTSSRPYCRPGCMPSPRSTTPRSARCWRPSMPSARASTPYRTTCPRRHRAGHRRSSGATADGDRPRHPHRTPSPLQEPPPPPARSRRTHDMNDTAEFTTAAIASICRTAHKYPDLRRPYSASVRWHSRGDWDVLDFAVRWRPGTRPPVQRAVGRQCFTSMSCALPARGLQCRTPRSSVSCVHPGLAARHRPAPSCRTRMPRQRIPKRRAYPAFKSIS